MKQRLTSIITAFAIVATALFVPVPVFAACPPTTSGQVQCGLDSVAPSTTGNLTDSIKTIINVLLFVLGAIAVIMIIIGGFRYVLSAGESSAITAAKNTIFYAVIGLVVAILAFAIVNFVLKNVK